MNLRHPAAGKWKQRLVHVAATRNGCCSLSGEHMRVADVPAKLAFDGAALFMILDTYRAPAI